MSKPIDRLCVKCGKRFRSNQATCSTCRAAKRQCIGCGREFISHKAKCSACSKTARSCGQCGNLFTGATRTCGKCRGKYRTCEKCGNPCNDDRRICSSCRPQRSKPVSRERACKSCGRTFRSSGNAKCGMCRRATRICKECGSRFHGAQLTCGACLRGKKRACVKCGKPFRSSATVCRSCYWASLPPPQRRALTRAYGNARRARRFAAQIAGPVPRTVYESIAASGPCVYCGGSAGTVDHVRPLARGGHEAVYNLVAACDWCNKSKNDRLLTEWDTERVARAARVSANVTAELARLLDPDALTRWEANRPRALKTAGE